ncbi:MAG: NAD-dependent epimerase/dehydratase family protein [Pseudomonadota bacterium]|nr:NAD-dependent epimerase/dehydratase family protein [Pseudomonadota bacterium]MDE3038092.1 NAD-dependent epimerase/dehydratase family protein [Pseudomonadota bacterium]
MRVLITGGSGFIGSHYAERLLARGDEVLSIDNFATGRRDNLREHENLLMVEGSIASFELMQSLFRYFKPEVVVHTAASYKDPDAWVNDVEVNVKGTAIACQMAKEAGTKRFVYFQTALCYGVKPLENPITLDHPILPEGSSYAISKTAAEQYIRLSGLDYVSFRLANAYGPRNLSGPLPTFYKRLIQRQECFISDSRRDFIFIDDLVDCALKAADGAGHGVYHISTGGDMAIIELYDATLKALRINDAKKPDIRARNPDDAPSILLDPSRTEQEFGWKARTGLAEGVAKAVEYYQKFGIDQTYTHLSAQHDKKVA